jgi:hypothetical protein
MKTPFTEFLGYLRIADKRTQEKWPLLDNFRASEGAFQGLGDVVSAGGQWAADEV